MSFLNRSLFTMVVVGSSFLPAHAQTWPRHTIPSYPTQGPCPPGTMPGTLLPSYPTTPPAQAMPSSPASPMSPTPGGTPAPMSETIPGRTPSPMESILPSPLTGQVNPIQSGVGDDSAFVDRGGSSALTSLTPLIGDLGVGGYRSNGRVMPGSGGVAIIARSAFKIPENESPQPINRLFATYHYFNDVRSGSDRFDFHREIVGFERTFLEGKGSFGIRLPMLQTNGPNGLSESGLGNLSLIGKYAFYNNPNRGLLLSTGAVVTIPSGSTFRSLGLDHNSDAVFIQPFLGGIYDLGAFYIQGFSSIAIPTETQQTVFMFNSFGFNYRLYRSDSPTSTVRFIIPTVEGHLTTPLNNRTSENTDFGFPDLFALTVGSQMGLFDRLVVKTGISMPLTGPRPHSFEGILQFNLLF